MAGHEISELMAIPPMNVSRAVSALTARGWVDRIGDVADRRRKPVQLSEAGLEGYRGMTPALAAIAEQLLGTLTANEREVLRRATMKISARIEDWPAEHPKAG